MLDTIFTFLVWGVVGAIPGYYASFFKGYRPLYGVGIGAVVGMIVGVIGINTGIISSVASAIVILMGLGGVAALLLPSDDYIEKNATLRQRSNYLAYALIIPTTVIVMGIVIFPLIWNLIFSVRDIGTADLMGVELFDFSELTLENFTAQAGVRFDRVPCVEAEAGGCALNEEGAVEYEEARRYFEDYRGWRALNELNMGDEQLVVGVRNRDFYPMIFRTFAYTVASSVMAIFFGLVAALVANDTFPGRNVFRSFLLFPYIAPVISVAFVWQVLLRQNGIVNGVFGTNVPFLATNDTWLGISIPLLMVILFQTWRYFPFAFLFLLARIQAVPTEIYEAAKVDGALPSERLLFITLPQLRAVIGTLFLLRFIWTFNKFDDVFLLTGTNPDTKVIPVAIFEALFAESNVGEASAIAVIMAGILAVVLMFYFRFVLVEEA